MIFREANAEDISQIAEIELVSIPGEPWREADFASCLSNKSAFLFVAESDNKIAGYVALYVAADEAELPTIAVEPSFRGKGVAKYMMTEALSRLGTLGVKELFLEVRESNTAACRLYETIGFEEIGRRKAFYIDPVEDALLLKKYL